MEGNGKQYDVFISHASEDKDAFVRPLANELERWGLKVWYDEFALRLGDSLSASIDRGIQDSRYGLLVLSPSFLGKNWPDYEYRSLLTRQIDGERVILPLWYGVGKDDVKKYSPYLADIKGLVAHEDDLRVVVAEILRVVRPDILREMRMRDTLRRIVREGTPRKVNVSDVVSATSKRSTLTPEQRVRCKAVYFGIGRHFDMSFPEFAEGYELDMVPERELQIWECMNAAYLEMLTAHPEATESERRGFYGVLVLASTGRADCSFGLSENLLKELYTLWLANCHEF